MKEVKNNETVGHLPCEHKDICGIDWPQTSLQTAAGRGGDSLYVGVGVGVIPINPATPSILVWKPDNLHFEGD